MGHIDTVKIYLCGSTWFFSAWSRGEFDCCYEIDDADTEEDACRAVAVLWPCAVIQRDADILLI